MGAYLLKDKKLARERIREVLRKFPELYRIRGEMAANLSGGVINPVRAVGPAIFSANFDYLAIWTVGPLVGALFGVVYNFLFLIKEKKG